jgi:hypothetical protein
MLRLQRTAGNQAVAAAVQRSQATPPVRHPQEVEVQRTAIVPASFFVGGARPRAQVDAGIVGNELRGFGTTVNGVTWHTRLTFGPLFPPGVMAGQTMHAEGSSVVGVVGPDHPYGSMPASADAAANNLTARELRSPPPRGHVAAHIINDQLGGPGISQNLFAFPATANTLMESQVETHMKTAVEAGHFIYYQAAVNHPATGPATSITMSWNKLDDAGQDIGGGQQNAVIGADDGQAGTDRLALGAGAPAERSVLKHPTTPTAIKAAPWGPFQMPDPKQAIPLTPFLNLERFPAVGSVKAFEGYLRNFYNSKVPLEMVLHKVGGVVSATTALGRWIQSGKSRVTVSDRRDINTRVVKHLIAGTTQQRIDAFIVVLGSGDREKVFQMAASLLAALARTEADTFS